MEVFSLIIALNRLVEIFKISLRPGTFLREVVYAVLKCGPNCPRLFCPSPLPLLGTLLSSRDASQPSLLPRLLHCAPLIDPGSAGALEHLTQLWALVVEVRALGQICGFRMNRGARASSQAGLTVFMYLRGPSSRGPCA